MLVVGTIGAAVAASRVAMDSSESASWILLAGCGTLLIVADLSREIEEAAGALADTSGVDRRTARRDIYRARCPRLLSTALIATLLFICSAVVLYAMP